ncbi:uncharacterized protein LOC117606753 isoform X3 [Osmia lignaria lignaria]|uniref:uncharacterized protein LOC117606753 isoform X3 n=1 Tax=Osmia lignaria lignaria TaxID=1437193 RepID=UPI001479074C|nr:uncharacterized protein LOC117606753 isoform X2 [Osmia lignaria]
MLNFQMVFQWGKNGNLLFIPFQVLRSVSRFRKHQLDLFRNMKRIYLYGKFLYDRRRFHCCNGQCLELLFQGKISYSLSVPLINDENISF